MVSLALLAANALGLVLVLTAARLLAPAEVGELAALLAVATLGVVPGAALQAVIARIAVTGPSSARDAHSLVVAVASATVAMALVLLPLVAVLVRPTDPWALAWLVVLLVPHCWHDGSTGLLLASARARDVALTTIVFSVLKLTGGVWALVLGAGPTGALAGTALGAAAGAVFGWLRAGAPGLGSVDRDLLTLVGRTTTDLALLCLLVTVDLVLARHVLPPPAAGAYAVASNVTRLALWLPQGAATLALPHLSHPNRRSVAVTRALLVAGVLTAALVLVTALAEDLVLGALGARPGGPAAGSLWMFALLGGLLAAGRLVLLGETAVRRRPTVRVAIAVVGLVAAVLALAGAGLATVHTVVLCATLAVATWVLAGLVTSRRGDRPADRPTVPTRGARR